MRRGGGSGKGSSFEREICKSLSLWWSQGERDDIFWRTAGSGARATSRAKQGKATSGAYGDLTFADPDGAPLLRVFCFELKRGYGRWCVLDLLDSKTDHSTIEDFWAQAKRSCEESGAMFPAVIFKRDQKVPCFMTNRSVLGRLFDHVGPYRGAYILTTIGEDSVVIMPLSHWLEHTSAKAIKEIAL